MWSTIDRARRRLDRAASATSAPAPEASAAHEPETPTPPPARKLEDVVIVFGPAELDDLRVALEQALGDAVERPDTPARIERALSLLLARRGAPGRPRVLRRPAGVSTPESWEIHLDGVEHATGTAVRGAGRTGRFHA
jgi:hypothetical protein